MLFLGNIVDFSRALIGSFSAELTALAISDTLSPPDKHCLALASASSNGKQACAAIAF